MTASVPTAGLRLARLLGQTGGLVVCYFAVPLGGWSGDTEGWLRLALAVAVLGLVVWWVVTVVAREARAEDADVRLDRLALAAVTGVLGFAVSYFLIERWDPDQFAGLSTRTDALYFVLTTLTTVGYGDVHAQGQLARQLVSAQLVFNVVVLAVAARTLAHGISQRVRGASPVRSGPAPDGTTAPADEDQGRSSAP